MRYGDIENRFYLFGGKDESSASLIQGMTLCGVLFDEVALMPRSFVEQALARCSVNGSKFWFNCNPEYPRHWFYTEWIRKADSKMRYTCILQWRTIRRFQKRCAKGTRVCIPGYFISDLCSADGLRCTVRCIRLWTMKNVLRSAQCRF